MHYAYAQQINGEIKNIHNEPLEYVNVLVKNQTKGTLTNANGLYSITLNSGEHVLEFSAIGYKTKTITVILENKDITLNVLLEEAIDTIEEVVVSASREKQLRNEVPAAIGVITTNLIRETKPIGIEQLVNQVPGVYMSTSKVASNEQHFMSVRSPISTKALFLYLEDGVQIRPTSVFNHNALLELNDIAYQKVEVLKGPASSIYGSESIGGSFNFITKNPTKDLNAAIGYQLNDLGFQKYEFEVSKMTSKNFGLYIASQYVERNDGPIEHSDYRKFGTTIKTTLDVTPKLHWNNTISLIDYRSDMTGSLSEEDYRNGNYESDQTFTNRDALAIRVKSSLIQQWNKKHKTNYNFIYRDNKMDQNPSYRIRQFRDQGVLTGFGSGEVNSNQFQSFVGLIQHKASFDFLKSSLIVGGTVDFSPQEYIAKKTDVIVDTQTGQNIDFTIRDNDFILNYNASILNYASYFQYEIEPLERLKITAALRYDVFEYGYDNNIPGLGNSESLDIYRNWTPKLGANYNITKNSGFYINYSQGFTPPQVSTLYRNRNELKEIKPSIYHNYEIGSYFYINDKWKIDGALYLLNGSNTLITLRDEDDIFFNTNAGKTQSYGIEYGITYTPNDKIRFNHSGSFAKHFYKKFFDSGIDYSNTEREIAPSLIGISSVTYRPIKNLSLVVEHELLGEYNTSFENQVANDNAFTTSTYGGHSIFNCRAVYQKKNFEVWGHLLNAFDTLYATRASYNRFRDENSYTVGNPRAFVVGLKVHL